MRWNWHVHNRGFAFVEVKPRITRNHDEAHRRSGVRCRRRAAGLRRADRYRRQHAHPGQGDPARIPPRRRRRVQRRGGPPIAASACTICGYFNSVDITDTPGFGAGQGHPHHQRSTRRRPANSRFGGGYSTDAGALVDIGLSETQPDRHRHQRRHQRRAGAEAQLDHRLGDRPVFPRSQPGRRRRSVPRPDQQPGTEPYDEKRVGFDAARSATTSTNICSQVWTYSLVGRTVFNVAADASFYIIQDQGYTLLSQIGQTITLDYRDSKIDPHNGYLVRAGHRLRRARRQRAVRPHQGRRQLFHPAGPLHRQQRLGRRARPAAAATCAMLGSRNRSSTASSSAATTCAASRSAAPARTTPSPATRWVAASSGPSRPSCTSRCRSRPTSGLSGRAFVDVGGADPGELHQAMHCRRGEWRQPCQIVASAAPRVGVGVGISWKTPFGLINVDLTPFVVKQPHDQTQIFRFGFGTRF